MSDRYLTASEAARRLGISSKALRLYERHGLVAPLRTAAGWRAYGPEAMRRAADIAALRGLGFRLAEVAALLRGDGGGLAAALRGQETALAARIGVLAATAIRVRELRMRLQANDAGDGLAQRPPTLPRAAAATVVAFALPWPWGGEMFELSKLSALTYITGPLGSGKTRLAKRLAETLPNAVFVGIDRLDHDAAATLAQLAADPVLAGRIVGVEAELVAAGATPSPALTALLVGLDMPSKERVIDMPEQCLDQATQAAVIAYLRRTSTSERPLFLLTRSSTFLDLDDIGDDAAIVFCPANHAVPLRVAPIAGTPGYEAVALCVAAPEVRARTEGVVAWRPQAAA